MQDRIISEVLILLSVRVMLAALRSGSIFPFFTCGAKSRK
jgi:hypothetical protein